MRLLWLAALGVSAAPVPFTGKLQVALTPARAGAANVTVRLRETTELQCGTPRFGPAAIVLPAAAGVPARLPRGTVRLNGAPVTAHVAGHRITFVIPPPVGVICDVIGPGSFTVSLAHVRNPVRPGEYRFSLVYGKRTLTATARVS